MCNEPTSSVGYCQCSPPMNRPAGFILIFLVGSSIIIVFNTNSNSYISSSHQRISDATWVLCCCYYCFYLCLFLSFYLYLYPFLFVFVSGFLFVSVSVCFVSICVLLLLSFYVSDGDGQSSISSIFTTIRRKGEGWHKSDGDLYLSAQFSNLFNYLFSGLF